MIRAVEKLRTESLRNGYMNWDDDFRHFVDYLRDGDAPLDETASGPSQEERAAAR